MSPCKYTVMMSAIVVHSTPVDYNISADCNLLLQQNELRHSPGRVARIRSRKLHSDVARNVKKTR